MNTPLDLETLKGFTPGPWFVGTMNCALFVIDEPPRPAPVDHVNMELSTRVIATPGEPHSEGWTYKDYTANASLIAAAPQLYAELVEARKALSTANANHEKFERLWYLEQDAREKLEAELVEARAALRKINCIYCGHIISLDDPDANTKLTEHITTCEANPLVVALAEATVDRDIAHAQLANIREVWKLHCGSVYDESMGRLGKDGPHALAIDEAINGGAG